ncbi:MAG: hypothetical protein MJZ00_04445 [Paludibacteraceae bacterium]|nr:hypothetical protein [Paludibacteraceae bacterium]
MGFFSKPEIRQFNYTPRYWDPRKEEMEQRRARIRKQLQEERERAAQEESGWKPRVNADGEEEPRSYTHRTTLQHGFLREQRMRTAGDDNKMVKVAVVLAVVLFAYLAMRHFAI